MVEVDDEVWAELLRRGEPLVDKANDVIRRALGLNGRSNAVLSLPVSTTRPSAISSTGSCASRSRLPRGERTPEPEYVIPILQALVEAGGRERAAVIVNRVGEIMKDRLNEHDRMLLPSGAEVRWRNAAEFCRNTMVHTKDRPPLLSPDSPHGYWEITDAGREHLKSHGS